MDVIVVATTALVAASFFISGASKLRRGDAFISVMRYELLPERVALVVAAGLPWAELILAMALVLGFAPTIALSLAGLLFSAFAVGVAVNLIRGKRFDCGCKGQGHPISWSIVVEDAAFALACGAAVLFGEATGLLPPLLGYAEPGTLTTLVGTLLGCLVALGYQIVLAARQAHHLSARPPLLSFGAAR